MSKNAGTKVIFMDTANSQNSDVNNFIQAQEAHAFKGEASK
jgi:hypothetical protein